MILLEESEGSDQTVQMGRVIWVFAVRFCPKTSFRMAWPSLSGSLWCKVSLQLSDSLNINVCSRTWNYLLNAVPVYKIFQIMLWRGPRPPNSHSKVLTLSWQLETGHKILINLPCGLAQRMAGESLQFFIFMLRFLGKNFSRQQFNFFFFTEKRARLFMWIWRQFASNVKPCFLGEKTAVYHLHNLPIEYSMWNWN